MKENKVVVIDVEMSKTSKVKSSVWFMVVENGIILDIHNKKVGKIEEVFNRLRLYKDYDFICSPHGYDRVIYDKIREEYPQNALVDMSILDKGLAYMGLVEKDKFMYNLLLDSNSEDYMRDDLINLALQYDNLSVTYPSGKVILQATERAIGKNLIMMYLAYRAYNQDIYIKGKKNKMVDMYNSLISLVERKPKMKPSQDAVCYKDEVLYVDSYDYEGDLLHSNRLYKNKRGFFLRVGESKAYLAIELLEKLIENYPKYKEVLYDEDIMNSVLKL